VITITTLADYFEGSDVYAHCEACGHHAPLDLPAIAKGAGWSTPLAAVKPKLRCKACRSRRVGLIIAGFPDPSGEIHRARRAVIEGVVART
jgi:hypothetical protein